MWRGFLSVTIALLMFTQTGCTFARYAKLHVQVVDEQTGAGIRKARVRTYYVKPMMDITYQRKDREKTDASGLATLTVATNWSQRMILGWTHGIIPRLAVKADGYGPRELGVPGDAFSRAEPLRIELEKSK